MRRFQLHGRGGQGIKTAGRVLGTSFFNEGFEVQDTPRYGAERRGAPIYAYVRADRSPIRERGVIAFPDARAISDASLLDASQREAAVGRLDSEDVLLIVTDEPADLWSSRLGGARVHTLAHRPGVHPATACAAGLARLSGGVAWASLLDALELELSGLGAEVLRAGRDAAEFAWGALSEAAGSVGPRVEKPKQKRVDWVDVPLDDVSVASPRIFATGNSIAQKTGLWRTECPRIDLEVCHRCWWICTALCPDNAMRVDSSGTPSVDLDHCKGCLLCATQCPHHAIGVVAEKRGAR